MNEQQRTPEPHDTPSHEEPGGYVAFCTRLAAPRRISLHPAPDPLPWEIALDGAPPRTYDLAVPEGLEPLTARIDDRTVAYAFWLPEAAEALAGSRIFETALTIGCECNVAMTAERGVIVVDLYAIPVFPWQEQELLDLEHQLEGRLGLSLIFAGVPALRFGRTWFPAPADVLGEFRVDDEPQRARVEAYCTYAFHQIVEGVPDQASALLESIPGLRGEVA